MTIVYRDEISHVAEKVDEDGVFFCGGKAYFNDKKVDVASIVSITESED